MNETALPTISLIDSVDAILADAGYTQTSVARHELSIARGFLEKEALKLSLPEALDGFVNVRVHKSITVAEMVHAAELIGCVLQASEHGLIIMKRGVKKRIRRKKEENIKGVIDNFLDTEITAILEPPTTTGFDEPTTIGPVIFEEPK